MNHDPSLPLKNARHEKFALKVAEGKSATEAYRLAGYGAKDADTAGPRLSGNVGIQKRVAHLQKKAETRTVLTITRKREILCDIAEDGRKDCDRVNAIKADNDLAKHGAEAGALNALAEQISAIRTKA